MSEGLIGAARNFSSTCKGIKSGVSMKFANYAEIATRCKAPSALGPFPWRARDGAGK
jgi:hypothetical protein